MLGGAWGRARRGGGLVTWVPRAPGELPCRAGHTACLHRAGDPAGRETIEAAPRELSETCSGRCREPWRRNWRVREGRGPADRDDWGEPIGSWFAGEEQE